MTIRKMTVSLLPLLPFAVVAAVATLPLHAQQNEVTTVSAASFRPDTALAPESIASAFGENLATGSEAASSLPLPAELAGTTLSVNDSQGIERAADLFFASPGQVNFLIPALTAAGPATVTIRSGDGSVSAGPVEIAPVSPSLFTANSTGEGLAAATALHVPESGVRTSKPVARFDPELGAIVAEGINFGPETNQVYLLLFGTGIRGFSGDVTVTVGEEPVSVLGAAAQQEFVGLDQVNAGPLPRSLIGRGDVEVALTVDGIAANTVIVNVPAAAELSPPAGEWGTRATLIESNSEMAVAEFEGKIYALGGYPSTRISVATVQVYDAAENRWELTTPLPMPLNHLMAAGVKGKVYVIGGQENASGNPQRAGFTDKVSAYDPATRLWTDLAPMPVARSGGAVGVIGDKIYVAGGRPPRGNDFAVYDVSANEWTALPDVPTQRNHIAAAAINGKIYVAGGRFGAGFQSETTPVLEVFDPETNAWASLTSLPRPRGGVNAVEALGCLHVFGGEGSDDELNGVFPDHDVYDPNTDTWTQLAPMPIPVHGVTGAAFVNGLIHLPGGGISEGGSSGGTQHQVYRPVMDCR